MGRTGEGKIESICETCGKSIFAYRSLKRRFCSHKCRPAETYSRTPHNPGAPTTKICPICGNEFFNHRSKAKYCSLICSGESRRTSSKEKCQKQRIEKQQFIKVWQAPNKWVWVQKKNLVILSECPCDTPHKEHHHPDYSKPLEVQRLCKMCHRREHLRLRKIAA